MQHDCIVVGAGASALAAATALLAAGRDVLMLDVGLTLEPERQAVLDGAPRPLNAYTAPWAETPPKRAGVPRKLLYGSDFHFREATEGIRLKPQNMGAEPSFALGGLTNVWGAAALPFTEFDTRDWPIRPADLEPHYRACAALLDLCEDEDALAEWFPLHAPKRTKLGLSKQASITLRALERHKDALNAEGIRFGRARVAANYAACTHCGLCLHGCPDRLIFAAAAGVNKLRANPRFTYQSDVIVEALAEKDGKVAAIGRDRRTGEQLRFEGRQLFLAAGALASTGILLRSAGAHDTPVRMLDCEYFLLPTLLLASGAGNVRDEQLHTMAQLFLEMRDPSISPYTVSMQLYTYNRLMADTMRTRLGPLSPLAALADAHMMLIQGHLHSAHSGSVQLTLRREGESDALEAAGQRSPEGENKVNALAAKLMRLAPRTKALPLTPLMEITEPGRSFHIGGTFPMREKPGRLETDVLGRPFGWSRTHVVDSTILPSIPGTTITYPVMANAHRIASAAASTP